MDVDGAAQGFSAMGSGARLQVLRVLVRAGEDGLAVGEIQVRTRIAPSTLNHHLRSLTDAGLVVQERIGRTIFSRADYQRLEALAGFILNECCVDAGEKAVNDD